jgi:hypothetical protein
MVNMTKTTKIIAFATILAFSIPTATFAAKDNSGSYDYSGSGWDSYTGGSGSSYSYGVPSYSSSYGYTPSYSYSTPSYGGGSYTGSSLGGYGYTPSYGGLSYGSLYTPPLYTGSSLGGYSYNPSSATSYSSSNPNTNSNAKATNDIKVTATGGHAVATGGSASSSNTNINNNVNNVYVYTNPTGNAVVHNPEYRRLDGYCVITPSNARLGQTVTATAYITGGIGNYTYTWGGDLATSASGVSTTFTSYNPGTKNITVTARSDQDVITKSCTVTFENNPVAVNSYSYNYGSSVTTGTPVSGVFLQPSYTQVTTGTPVSGVYLNELPATGVDLNWMHYMIGFMVIVLATIATAITKAKKSFVGSQE